MRTESANLSTIYTKEMPENSGSTPDKNNYNNKVFIVDKPLDFTSTDVVRIFKKNFHLDKIGHAGSLDPKATGLLILCSGVMTKQIDKYMDMEKEYSGIFRIGATTKCFDTEGTEENNVDTNHIEEKEVQNVKNSFIGEIEQVPPMYSALKHKGRPLYKLARNGDIIERKPRKIFIKDFDVKLLNESEVFFRVVCSKGTYVRVIANDFGDKLGVGAYLKELRRTRIGELNLDGLNQEVKDIKFKIL